MYMEENKLIIAPNTANKVNELASLLFMAGTLFFYYAQNRQI